jgi:hypothetical protein
MQLGGKSYLYTEQDWSTSPEALDDALVETAEAARAHLCEALSYYRGLQALSRHADGISIAKLAAEFPFLATILAQGSKSMFAVGPVAVAAASAAENIVS